MIVFVFVLVVAVVAAVVALALHGRSERGIESGISSFRRELDALAPRGEPTVKRPERKPIVRRDDDEVRTVQIGDRPPPRRPTPSVPPTGVPAPGARPDAGREDAEPPADAAPPADAGDPSVSPAGRDGASPSTASTDDTPSAHPEGSDDGA